MRLSIATKIFIAFAFLIVVFTGVLMFGIYRTQSLFNQIERLNRRIVPVSLSLSDAQTDLKSFNLLLNERDPLVIRRTLQVARLVHSLPDRIRQRVSRAREVMESSNLDRYDPVQSRQLDRLQRDLDALEQRATDFADRSEEFSDLVLEGDGPAEGDTGDEIRRLQSTLRDDADRLGSDISRLRSELRNVTDRALDRANENERSSLYALGGLSAVALLLAVGVLLAVLRIVRPLTTLTEAAKRIGEGDYRTLDEIPNNLLGRDEITLLAREFNAMAERLAERDEKLRDQHRALLKSERLATVGRMTSAITHELRNPLSSINLNAEMLMEDLVERGIDPEDPDVMPLLETIIDEVDRLHDITEEYLVYARLPSSELEPENLVEIAREMIDFHQTDWNRRDIEVRLQSEADAIDIDADANHLRQALLNIVKNAVEASPEGARVDVEISRDEESATVAIRDRGPGIAPEIRDELFEPFATTKSDGTGLGLAMTQQIVEQHHGEIRIEEPDGGGCRFVIELPLEGPSDDEVAEAAKTALDTDLFGDADGEAAGLEQGDASDW
jgi:signal transduction histidine kinase